MLITLIVIAALWLTAGCVVISATNKPADIAEIVLSSDYEANVRK